MAAPSVTLQSLQSELEALQELCPVLLPSVVPQGYDDEDLLGLVATEGKPEEERFKSQLRSLVKNMKQQQQEEAAEEGQQGPVHGCALCGAPGVPTCQAHAKADEGKALRFTTLPTVSFQHRQIHLGRAGFVCGSCRALQDPGRFLVFAASCAQPSAPAALRTERHALAASLALHLASVNGAPEQLQANVDALLVWAHEVMARAHALRVLASNVEGWRLLGPSGEPVTQATPGLSLRLLRALLLGDGKRPGAARKARKAGSRRSEGQGAEEEAAADGKPRKRPSSGAEGPEAKANGHAAPAGGKQRQAATGQQQEGHPPLSAGGKGRAAGAKPQAHSHKDGSLANGHQQQRPGKRPKQASR